MRNVQPTTIDSVELSDPDTHWPTRIWQRVIEQATQDLQLSPPVTATAEWLALREAAEWFFTPNSDYEEVCTLADMDPDTMRRAARDVATPRVQYHKEKAESCLARGNDPATPPAKAKDYHKLNRLHRRAASMLEELLDLGIHPIHVGSVN